MNKMIKLKSKLNQFAQEASKISGRPVRIIDLIHDIWMLKHVTECPMLETGYIRFGKEDANYVIMTFREADNKTPYKISVIPDDDTLKRLINEYEKNDTAGMVEDYKQRGLYRA